MSSIASSTYQPRIPARILCPERQDRADHWTERVATAVQGIGVVNASGLRRKRLSRIVQLVERHQRELARAGEQDLAHVTRDLRLSSSTVIKTIGGRAFVRFDHGREALAWRLYRQLRQVLLSQFNV